MDLEDAVSIHGDEEFDIEKDQEEKEDEKKSKTKGRQTLLFIAFLKFLRIINRDYFMVGECVRLLSTSQTNQP